MIVDDLRPDRLGFAGHAGARTPALDAFARRAVVYTQCRSTCGWTLPSCASIVTGLLPSGHGLVHHEHRFRAPKIPALLGPSYATFGVGNNGNLVPDEVTREQLDRAGFERRPDVWKHFGWQEGFETYAWFYKSDKDGPFAAFEEWRGERATDGRPWFAMLHTNIVHDYDRGDPWCTAVEPWLGAALPEALVQFRDGPHVWRDPPEGLDTASLRAALLAKYDACVAECDRRLGDVLARVDLASTVVIVVSDHGEGFDGERDRVHHCGRLHDDLLRVPLLVSYPAGTPGAPAPGSRVDAPASTLDIAPTALALAGADPAGLKGHDLRALPAGRLIEAEDLGYLYLPASAPGDAPDDTARLRRYEYKTHDIASRCTVENGRKLIHCRIGRQEWSECYDLGLDPDERVNRAHGAHTVTRRPRRDEGPLGAVVRSLRTESSEAKRLRLADGYAAHARRSAAQRRLPPLSPVRAFERIAGAEPITFAVVVDDAREFDWHVGVSAVFGHDAHEWLLYDNHRNRATSAITRLYTDALSRARNDLVFFVHQDVLFPPDWEARLFAALLDLERRDPAWGVIGAAGRAVWDTAAGPDGLPRNIGHWSDPHGYHKPRVELPAEVQVLDELWLGVRRSSGVAFDPGLPGFHCYGADLCMAARALGRKSYVIDAPVVHKLFRPDGSLIERSDQSHKIAGRETRAFRADFLASAAHVARRWKEYLPFASTCHHFEA